MLEEAMKAVSQAEAEADEIIEAAKQKAVDIRKQAEADAEELKLKAKAESEDYLSKGLESAAADGETAHDKTSVDAEKEAKEMTERAAAKEAEAIKAIIDEIINNK